MALKEDKVYVTSGRKKAIVRRETSAVSGMRVMIVHQKRHRKPLHPLSHQLHEVEVRREKRSVRARSHLVSIGILPNVKSIQTKTGCKAGDKCLFPHHEVDEQPNKKP